MSRHAPRRQGWAAGATGWHGSAAAALFRVLIVPRERNGWRCLGPRPWSRPAHGHDVELAELIGPVLAARPAALSVNAATPRHALEWRVFDEVALPEGKMLIPGVTDSTTNYIEHPQLVADRITRYARIVGPERSLPGGGLRFRLYGRRSGRRSEDRLGEAARARRGRVPGRVRPLYLTSLPGVPIRRLTQRLREANTRSIAEP
jgi:hypothetical protein